MAVLRVGYATLGIAFAALAATLASPSLILAGLALAFVAGLFLAFTDDHLPKWAGIALLVYFLLSVAAFLAATPVTINRGGESFFVNKAPPGLADDVIDWMGRFSPLMLSGAALAATWEREKAPRTLLFGALGGFALHAVLYVALVPTGADVDSALAAARSQEQTLSLLFALSAGVAALAAFWAMARPDSGA